MVCLKIHETTEDGLILKPWRWPWCALDGFSLPPSPPVCSLGITGEIYKLHIQIKLNWIEIQWDNFTKLYNNKATAWFYWFLSAQSAEALKSSLKVLCSNNGLTFILSPLSCVDRKEVLIHSPAMHDRLVPGSYKYVWLIGWQQEGTLVSTTHCAGFKVRSGYALALVRTTCHCIQ